MPNMQDRKAKQFSRFDAMSTDELQAFLREDDSKPMGEESDTEEIFYVMEVLAKRRKEQQEGKDPAKALATFKHNYYTENETPSISESVPVVSKRSNSGRWKRGLVAAVAALFILVIGNSITVSALGFDLFAIIAKWTQETFHFSQAGQVEETNAPSPNFARPCGSLQAALDEYKVKASLVPTWMPGGYEECDIKTTENPAQRHFLLNIKMATKPFELESLIIWILTQPKSSKVALLLRYIAAMELITIYSITMISLRLLGLMVIMNVL